MFGNKHNFSAIKVVMLLMVFVFTAAFAGTAKGQELSTLAEGQTVDGTSFFSGSTILVEGTVNGTAFAFGEDVRIEGTINGDLIVAGKNVNINGQVNGNIYTAAQILTISAKNTGDAFFAAQTLNILKDTEIGRDLFGWGRVISTQGNIKRDFTAAGSDIAIKGYVGRDAKLQGERINIQQDSVIIGDLTYKSANKANIYDESKISGKTYWQATEPKANQQRNKNTGTVWNVIWSVVSALFVWFIVKIWRPELWSKNAEPILNNTLKSIGTGVIAFLVTPLIVILLMITVIGIPLGIITVLLYGIILYISKIIAAVFIGEWLTKRFNWSTPHKGVWPVLLGLTIIVLITRIPVVGFLFWLLIVFSGFGAFIITNYRPIVEKS